MCWTGIGGSALGPQALLRLLEGEPDRRVIFFDNVDPAGFDLNWREIGDPDTACFVFASKSGTTIETWATLQTLEQRLLERGRRLDAHNALVVTEPTDNPLADWARARGIEVVEIPVDVGGRFSVLSAVGLVPAAFVGLPIEDLLQGASGALLDARRAADAAAAAFASFRRGESITLFWLYADAYDVFGRWLVQLWAESLGKPPSLIGVTASTPMLARGATDQHSVLQQLSDGPRDKWVVFFEEPRAATSEPSWPQEVYPILHGLGGRGLRELLRLELIGTMRALSEKTISTCHVQVAPRNGRSVGFLFMHFQLLVACLGRMLGVDPYNQPGVESAKAHTRRLVSSRSSLD
jgi:glucose-6-phosphate isomerase